MEVCKAQVGRKTGEALFTDEWTGSSRHWKESQVPLSKVWGYKANATEGGNKTAAVQDWGQLAGD